MVKLSFSRPDYYETLKQSFLIEDNKRMDICRVEEPKCIAMNPYSYFLNKETRNKEIRNYELFLRIEKRRAANKVASKSRKLNRMKMKGK